MTENSCHAHRFETWASLLRLSDGGAAGGAHTAPPARSHGRACPCPGSCLLERALPRETSAGPLALSVGTRPMARVSEAPGLTAVSREGVGALERGTCVPVVACEASSLRHNAENNGSTLHHTGEEGEHVVMLHTKQAE